MRRADRLFRLIQILRRRRTSTTAAQLAAELEVSARTVYRDVRDLVSSGVPIAGEPGVGYLLRGYDLPPLLFTEDELEALVLGTRVVESWADPQLARAAADVLAKVEAVMPASRRDQLRRTKLYAPGPEGPRRVPVRIDLGALRRAIRATRKIRFAYTDAHGAGTERTVWPLAMTFFGPVWLVPAWCELRSGFRAFRPDRMRALQVLDERYPENQPGRTLADFVTSMQAGLPDS